MDEEKFELMARAFQKEHELAEVISAFRGKHNMFRRLELYEFLELVRIRFALQKIASKKK